MNQTTKICRTREEILVEQYGELLRFGDLAKLLSYPSEQAIKKARERGKLPVQVFRIQKRHGWFATTRTVARFLDSLDQQNGGAQ
jgi:hypothetical protein